MCVNAIIKCVHHNFSASGFFMEYNFQNGILDHSRKILVGFLKGIQKVHWVHVVDVKNLQVKNQHCLVCMWGCLCYQGKIVIFIVAIMVDLDTNHKCMGWNGQDSL
jgi:hypothetical protein